MTELQDLKPLAPLKIEIERNANGNVLQSHLYHEGPISMAAVDALTAQFRGLLVNALALDPEETESERQLRRDWLDKQHYLREGWGQHVLVAIQGQAEDPQVVLERKRAARLAEQGGPQ